MIIRLVKMTFRTDAVHEFHMLFNERKERIRNFEGCNHLELLEDKNNNNICFTYSYWESEEALGHYRNSDFFKNTWKLTKALFREKAEAWTVESKAIL